MKNQKGITIVTLVITIIVLSILAGITVNTLIGDNGVIQQAKQQRENIEIQQRDEQIKLNVLKEALEEEVNIGTEDDLIEQLDRTTATEDKILKDYIAYSNGELIIGTMPDNGAVNINLNCSEVYTIPKGYHDGTGIVTANSLESQTEATATAEDILEGKTAWVNGTKLTGIASGGGYTVLAFKKSELGNSNTKADIASVYTGYTELELWKNLFICATSNYANHTGATGGHTFSYDATTGILTIGSTNDIAKINGYNVYIIEEN